MQDWFLRNSETNRSCLKGWCMPVVLKSAHQFTRQISKQQSSNNQVEVFHPLTKQLRVFHVSSEPQMCPHWLVSLYVYRSGNDTHCSAKGPCSRHTCTHTHTHTETVCMIACTCNQTQTNRHVHAQKHTFTALHLHTQTHILGQVSRWHSSTLANTHTNSRTLTRWARRPDGVTAWAVGLSHSGDLISHCFFSFTDPYSSLPSSHLPSFFFTLSSMSTHFTLFFLSFCSQILALYISINSRCQFSMHLSILFGLPCH